MLLWYMVIYRIGSHLINLTVTAPIYSQKDPKAPTLYHWQMWLLHDWAIKTSLRISDNLNRAYLLVRLPLNWGSH